MNADSFSFELVDRYTPEQVVKEELAKIKEYTRGYVEAHVEKYAGHVTSYTKKATNVFTSITGVLTPQPEEIEVDIQDELGEQSNQSHKFEVYLSVKGLSYYKYRMMIIYYGAISYPATFVMSRQIAEIYDPLSDGEDVFSNMKSIEEMIQKVLDSTYLRRLIQSLINEAIRAENKEIIEPKGEK